MLRRRAGRRGPVAELLPAQADLLLEQLDLAVAVALLLAAAPALLLPPTQVALHQLDGGDQGLGDAEVGVLLGGEGGGRVWVSSSILPPSCSERGRVNSLEFGFVSSISLGTCQASILISPNIFVLLTYFF